MVTTFDSNNNCEGDRHDRKAQWCRVLAMANKPYDESIEVDDSEEVFTPRNPDENPHQTELDPDGTTPEPVERGDTLEGSEMLNQTIDKGQFNAALGHNIPTVNLSTGDNEEEENELDESEELRDDDDQDESELEVSTNVTQGAYDPNEFAHLPVTSEIREMFKFIQTYRAQVTELEAHLYPFLPDYIPSVGDIDAFIKVIRPDEVDDNLGLAVVDEPCAAQSDPTVLDMQLRSMSKEAAPPGVVMKRVERADKNPKELQEWIKSVYNLHRSKPPTIVHYSRAMPDIDQLMAEWPPHVEETLKVAELPTAELGVPLEQYVDVILALTDIPVYKSRVQSLHVLFTLFSEFKNSQHFKQLAEQNDLDNNNHHDNNHMIL